VTQENLVQIFFARRRYYDRYKKYIRYTGLSSGVVEDFFRMVDGQCPKIMKFFFDIMSPEDVEIFLDFFAYCLWREYKFNFWVLLNGSGFNGKSILLDLLDRFLGTANVSGETLDRLLHERFAIGNLYQKMINLDADVSADVILDNTGIIKKLTGNDVHTGEFKYLKPFRFTNYAKLFFSCNLIPDTQDRTDAFLRRIIIINFIQQFFGEKEDPYMINKISTDEEFSGLLYELLCRLPRVLKNGIKKITSEELAKTYDKYIRGSRPVRYFYEKALAGEVDGRVKKLDMFEHYEAFCKYHGLSVESEQSFSRRLKDEVHLVTERLRIDGERVYVWMDVKLVDWVKKEEEEQSNLQDFTPQQQESMR
jgi:putative DNA primase/helicase